MPLSKICRLTSNVLGNCIRQWNSESRLGHRGRVIMNRIHTPVKVTLQSSLMLLPFENTEKNWQFATSKKVFTRAKTHWYPELDFQILELWDKNFFFNKPVSLWYSFFPTLLRYNWKYSCMFLRIGYVWVQSLAWEDPLEKRKATHSSILA